MDGDQDDHNLMQAHQQALLAQQKQHQQRLPDESEVNSADDDTGTNIYAIPARDSDSAEEDEEGLDSPVDDIVLEEQ